jgi:hypothetical protein
MGRILRIFLEKQDYNFPSTENPPGPGRFRERHFRAEAWRANPTPVKTACDNGNDIISMTFGEYIRMIEERCSMKRETILCCKDKLRVLLASMFGISPGNKKYDHTPIAK